VSVFTVTVPGLPRRCPYCGHAPNGRAYPLSYYISEIVVCCPACRRRLGSLVAVPPAEEE
jgi:hypothetical protein